MLRRLRATTTEQQAQIEGRQLATERGEPEGYASLDSDGKVPPEELPLPDPSTLPDGSILLVVGGAYTVLSPGTLGQSLVWGENGPEWGATP